MKQVMHDAVHEIHKQGLPWLAAAMEESSSVEVVEAEAAHDPYQEVNDEDSVS